VRLLEEITSAPDPELVAEALNIGGLWAVVRGDP
jgi:ABC-type histidine transport system ATPase subunit